MKTTTFLTALLAMLMMAACTPSKKEFKISGELPAIIEADSVVLVNTHGEMFAQAPVVDHKFVLTGSLTQPRKLILGSEKGNFSFDIILENDNYTFKVDGEGYATLTGGKIHQDVLGYKQEKEYVALAKEYHRKSEEAFANVDMENEEQVTKAREINNAYFEKMMNYGQQKINKVIEGDYPAITKMFALIYNQDAKKYTLEKMKTMFAEYKKEMGDHPDMDDFLKSMEEYEQMEAKQQKVSNGNPFIEIEGADRNGNLVKLSDVVAKNEYTILEFWASWCGPCRGEIPNLKKAYAKYKSKGLEIVSVSVDDNHAKWIKAMDEEQPTWINLLIENNFKNPSVVEYGINGVPASFLINKEGIIIANNDELREFNLDKTLSKIIK